MVFEVRFSSRSWLAGESSQVDQWWETHLRTRRRLSPQMLPNGTARTTPIIHQDRYASPLAVMSTDMARSCLLTNRRIWELRRPTRHEPNATLKVWRLRSLREDTYWRERVSIAQQCVDEAGRGYRISGIVWHWLNRGRSQVVPKLHLRPLLKPLRLRGVYGYEAC
jgi:hypothetical protein